MNRELRRKLEKQVRRKKVDSVRKQVLPTKPLFIEAYGAFAPFLRFLEQVASGEVDSVNGVLVLKDFEGGMFEALPNAMSFVYAVEEIFEKTGCDRVTAGEFEQAKLLFRKLHHQMPVTKNLADSVLAFGRKCEAAFRGVDLKTFKETITTHMIRMEMELRK